MRVKSIQFLSILAMMTAVSCGQAGQSSVSGKEGSYIEASSKKGIVETESGKVGGYVEDGMYIFKGIPYAKAERFMPPHPVEKWDGIRSCRHYGPTAPQAARAGYAADEIAFAFDWDDGYAGEDCQRLNIWTPGVNDGKKRPVMVWLHGGGYSAGSGQELPSYEGTNLAAKGDVVVVSLNHRLNVLGFLDLSAFGEKYAKSGNAGLLDIVAALDWVHNNIANFGGDPSNVTIFGQSGGGGKVSILSATPAAKGLFHKAIVQSGSTLRTMESSLSRRIGIAVIEELGIKPSQLDQLASVSYDRLLDAGTKAIARVKEEYIKEGGNAGLLFGWAPTVDGAVIPDQPYDGKGPGQSVDIPMIIGTTLNEFAPSVYAPQLRNLTMEQVAEMAKGTYGEYTSLYIDTFKSVYPHFVPNDIVDYDTMFRLGAVKQANVKFSQNGAPVWMYIFAWQSPVLDGSLKSTHCMEIPFVFNNACVHSSMTGGGDEAVILASRMSEAWINFARTGNPNGSGIDGVPEWKPYTPSEGATMWWDNTCEIKCNHDKALLEIAESAGGRTL
ncbi:MAG: carboxylesterase/lipase family protein [Bacteroidales bacterium]|nr:carboxylesterase/lipase family protein [Bacteroidales bacterium]